MCNMKKRNRGRERRREKGRERGRERGEREEREKGRERGERGERAEREVLLPGVKNPSRSERSKKSYDEV
jgi:hypothetical protein